MSVHFQRYRQSLPSTQVVTPVAAGTTTLIRASQMVLLMDHSATIASHTIVFPAAPNNGDTVLLSSRAAITTLTLSLGGVNMTGTISTLAAGGFAAWQYNTNALKWFRVG